VKLACAIACFAAQAAWSAVPGLPTGLTVRVVDEAGRPVPEAFVVAREFVNVPQMHGSRTYCDRADAVRAGPAEVAMRLPAAGMGHMAPGRTYAMEAFAYVKGHCVAPTGAARAAAYSLSVPPGIRGQEPPKTVQAGEAVTLRAREVAGAEERLEYLLNFSSALLCESWSDRSKDGVAQLVSALRAEAQSMPRESAYAKSLAQRLGAQLDTVARLDKSGGQMPPMSVGLAPSPLQRNFLVAPANARLHWPSSDTDLVVMAVDRSPTAYGAALAAAAPVAVAPARPGALQAATPSGTVIRAEPAQPQAEDTRLTIHCRPGATCNLDERDAQGQTALHQYASDLDVDRFRLLLERGADPSVAVDRHGSNAVDAVLRRAVMQPPALGSINADKAREIIDLIAASPKAGIRASLAAQLKSEPALWFVKSPESLAILTHARAKLAALPTRADGAGACERIEVAPGYDAGPLRLR